MSCYVDALEHLNELREEMQNRLRTKALSQQEGAVVLAFFNYAESVLQRFEEGEFRDQDGREEPPLSRNEWGDLIVFISQFMKERSGGTILVKLSPDTRRLAFAFNAIYPLLAESGPLVHISPDAVSSNAAQRYARSCPEISNCAFLTWESAVSARLEGHGIVGETNLPRMDARSISTVANGVALVDRMRPARLVLLA